MPGTTNLYGEPLLTRKSDIANKVAVSQTLYPIELMGRLQSLKQIRVRITLPVYRLENGRTRTFQKEYLATHPDAPRDLFTLDPESIEAQKAQHEILLKLAADEDLLKEFSSGTMQTEPIIITCTGVVVNGNRRLCAWRSLYYGAPDTYRNFEYIEVAVLPEDCDETEIRALEKRLQIQKTHRAEYKWHTRAAMMKEERESGATLESIAKSYDISKKDVETIIGALDYAEIYLQKIGKPDQWSLVDADEFAFKAMVEERKKISDQGKKELFEAVCFKLIEKKDYQGRLYSSIPDIATHLDIIASELQAEGLLPSTTTGTTTGTPSGEAQPSGDNTSSENGQDDFDLLGGDVVIVDRYSELATALGQADTGIGGVVRRVADEQRSLRNEQRNARFLINTLANVSRTLWNIRSAGLNENTVLDGAENHLTVIKDHISAIEDWINAHRGQS